MIDRYSYSAVLLRLVIADLLALQVREGTDVVMHEQVEAAGVHARQRRDRHAGIEGTDGPGREPQTKVDLAALKCLSEGRPGFTRT